MNIRQLLVFLHDLAWVPLSAGMAWWLRFNLGAIPEPFRQGLVRFALGALVVQAAANAFFGLYRGVWRFASLPDLARVLKAVGAGALAGFAIAFLWFRLAGVPRSALVLYPLLLAIGLAGPRILYRWLKDRSLLAPAAEKRVLVVGAGEAAAALVREMRGSRRYLPLGLLDDDAGRHGREVQGVRVLGSIGTLPEWIRRLAPDLVLIAAPSLPPAKRREVVEACARAGIPCRILPPFEAVAEGRVELAAVRAVSIQDLLGRPEVRLDEAPVRALLEDAVVLVTGAGGSIGSELARQIARLAPARLVLVDHGEHALFRIEREMEQLLARERLACVLADVRDRARMRMILEEHRPQILFHAAAYKHVPIVERNPVEGVEVNAVAAWRLMELAEELGVARFVQISTDKAVNPTNVMGAAKRAAEIAAQGMAQQGARTRFITTRFGNVLGSAGSVVPTFEEQIRRGGPVTVTHPEITRYFMTIPEAVRLILQAAARGEGGEIFVLDMGEPVKIVDLARQMIRLAGLEPEEDIPIVFTGLRPGEKLYEELFYPDEAPQPISVPGLLLARARRVDWPGFISAREVLEEAAGREDAAGVRAALRALVPEYHPADA